MDEPGSNSDSESVPLPAVELDLVQTRSRRPEIKAFCYLCLSSSSAGDPTLSSSALIRRCSVEHGSRQPPALLPVKKDFPSAS